MPSDAILEVNEVRRIEAAAAAEPLMERAGRAAAEVAREMLATRAPRAWVLAGPGNNGGDALVVARWLRQWFFDVRVAFAGDASRLSSDAAAAHQAWQAAGGTMTADLGALHESGLIVDGLFGIGLKRTIEAPYVHWIDAANASAVPVLALDVPSGLDADTGVAGTSTMQATRTITFIALKPGLLTGDGVDRCGVIDVAPIGLDATCASSAHGERVTWKNLCALLPAPLRRERRNVNKGTFGALGIIGGADGMLGAAILAGRAALHLGTGKLHVGFASARHPGVDLLYPELMLRGCEQVLAARPDALVVGPGLGSDDGAAALLAAALDLGVPAVLDADALTLLTRRHELAAALRGRAGATVLTPHPGEAARLLDCDVAAIQADRLAAARRIAARHHACVALKGAGTVLAFPDGRWAINASGNSGLATAGTGDVLSGMIGALLAQGIEPVAATKIGVCLHGAAADALVQDGEGPIGLSASSLGPAARALLNAARAV